MLIAVATHNHNFRFKNQSVSQTDGMVSFVYVERLYRRYPGNAASKRNGQMWFSKSFYDKGIELIPES